MDKDISLNSYLNEHHAENALLGNFDKFVGKLPSKEKTMLGKFDEGAVEISGGEWHQIAIQRALINENVGLLIFDEPAAALDPLVESSLYNNIMQEQKGKTCIMTSHRLAACKMADKILVFEEGTLLESGSHSELMKLGGLYSEMYSSQQSLYQ